MHDRSGGRGLHALSAGTGTLRRLTGWVSEGTARERAWAADVPWRPIHEGTTTASCRDLINTSLSIHLSRLFRFRCPAAYSMLYTPYSTANAIRPTRYFGFGSTRIPYSPLNAMASQNASSNQTGLGANLVP